MKLKIDKKKIIAVAAVMGTIGISIFVATIPTNTFIEFIGTENTYIFMFLIALVGSISTFASIPYPLILIGLVNGGVDPVYAGLASAAGVIFADSITFFAVKRGKVLLSGKLQSSVEYLGGLIEKYPKLITPGLFTYGTFSPLSNDFAVITFSLMKYSFFRVILPLAFGNVVYNISVAYFGSGLVSWFTNLF